MTDAIKIDAINALKDKELVMIQWIKVDGPQNAQVTQEWEDIAEDDIDEDNISHCFSVGYIVKDTKYFIKISPHIVTDEEGLKCSGSIAIPKSSIVEKRILTIGDKEDLETE